MSAREIIAHIRYKPISDRTVKLGFPTAEAILEALTAAGYRILATGQTDPETLEKAASAAELEPDKPGVLRGCCGDEIASAIRALGKEGG